MERRNLIKALGMAGMASIIPPQSFSLTKNNDSPFSFCLNTSTVKGTLTEKIDIASDAGYDGVELWIRDIKKYTDGGKTIKDLHRYIADKGLKVENAIGFVSCFIDDEKKRLEAFKQMRVEMEIMTQLGCPRIAASPVGLKKDSMPEWFDIGKRYKALLNMGRETGVMPQLEFWGASGTLFHIGQALMIAAWANDSDARILADVYHMFRGNSGFEGLKMLNGNLIEIFHMNDYPSTISREEQKDADRVYPGDGAAPIKQILTDLKNMGGKKILSLELFNPEYWKQDQLMVAKTGLQKMKALVRMVS
jgi:2-keto-myo-inositol isomerase